MLCDRFTDSTEAYQGGGRQLGSEPVLRLHQVLCGGLWPDLTILMDSDVSSSVSRARRRNKSAEQNENRFEKESQAFFSRVREGFLEIAETRAAARRDGGRAARRSKWCMARLWSGEGEVNGLGRRVGCDRTVRKTVRGNDSLKTGNSRSLAG